MTIFTILVRFSLTLFIVPAMSLGAEMSSDFEERTSITSIRITFGALISIDFDGDNYYGFSFIFCANGRVCKRFGK